jgi:hypothetical protein
MDAFTTPGAVRGTALELAPSAGGKPDMTVLGPRTSGHSGVLLDADWVLPLAAWFAGEAQPVSLGGRPGTLYGRTLDVRGDERAIVWNTHTWARLDCLLPFGDARVTIGPRGKGYGSTVMISPEARQDVAAWLRRANSEGWTRRELTA